ncbi:MAG TPA: hypothetical protein VFK05_22160 [Polyangiaceae bacterium]|nr:hypothetical protein [Polyangiaceae bacterium]
MATPQKPARPLLERWGGRYLESGRVAASQADDPIHVLNPVERAGLLRVTRGAVLRAALAGVINAAATGFGALFAAQVLGHEPEHATWLQHVSYWGLFGVLALIAAVLEIVYLYWDGLRAVRELSLVAGLQLDSLDNLDVRYALARAALELPNPPDVTFGVNPHREASKFTLATASLVYKLKISVTNFVFKALVERAIGRLATRSVLAFTAIPINAAWNAAVCWFVLREARIRVMGPSAASEMLDVIFAHEPQPSPALLTAIHCALGAAVVRTNELHPNHLSLMRELRQRFGEPPAGVEVDDTRVFLSALPKLTPAERRTAVRVLTVAAILDGRLVKRERRLLLEAYHAASIAPALEHVELLRKAFVSGDPILGPELLASAS